MEEHNRDTISLSLGSTPNLGLAQQARSDYNSYESIKDFFANLNARKPAIAEKLAIRLCAELEQYRNPVVEEGFDEVSVEQEQEESDPHPSAGTW